MLVELINLCPLASFGSETVVKERRETQKNSVPSVSSVRDILSPNHRHSIPRWHRHFLDAFRKEPFNQNGRLTEANRSV
jgi:hypothetical protein